MSYINPQFTKRHYRQKKNNTFITLPSNNLTIKFENQLAILYTGVITPPPQEDKMIYRANITSYSGIYILKYQKSFIEGPSRNLQSRICKHKRDSNRGKNQLTLVTDKIKTGHNFDLNNLTKGTSFITKKIFKKILINTFPLINIWQTHFFIPPNFIKSRLKESKNSILTAYATKILHSFTKQRPTNTRSVPDRKKIPSRGAYYQINFAGPTVNILQKQAVMPRSNIHSQ